MKNIARRSQFPASIPGIDPTIPLCRIFAAAAATIGFEASGHPTLRARSAQHFSDESLAVSFSVFRCAEFFLAGTFAPVNTRTPGDRIADVIAAFSGSIRFVWLHLVGFALRISPEYRSPSPQRILLIPTRMCKQNRETRRGDMRDHLKYSRCRSLSPSISVSAAPKAIPKFRS